MMTNEGNTYDPGPKPRPDSEMEDVLLPNEGPWSLTYMYLIVSLSLVDRFIRRDLEARARSTLHFNLESEIS